MFETKLNGLRQYVAKLETDFGNGLGLIDNKLEYINEDVNDEFYHLYIERLIHERDSFESNFIYQYRNSTLVSIYSLLESRVNELADVLGEMLDKKIKISDLSGEGVVRAKKYFEKVCELEFEKINSIWSAVMELNTVRNCIVHCEGSIERARSARNLKNIVQNSYGLSESKNKTILIERTYIECSIDNIESFHNHLIENCVEKTEAYNKLKNEYASKAGTDAQKGARPFEGR